MTVYKCPKCGATNLQYQQQTYEYYEINSLDDRGEVEFGDLVYSYPSDRAQCIICQDCLEEFDPVEVYEANMEEDNGR